MGRKVVGVPRYAKQGVKQMRLWIIINEVLKVLQGLAVTLCIIFGRMVLVLANPWRFLLLQKLRQGGPELIHLNRSNRCGSWGGRLPPL